MIEVTQRIKFVLIHPINKNSTIEFVFPTERSMDEWLPYLTKIEDMLIQEALKTARKQ